MAKPDPTTKPPVMASAGLIRQAIQKKSGRKKPRFDWFAHQRAEEAARSAAVAPVSDAVYAAEMRRMTREISEGRKKRTSRKPQKNSR